MYSLILKCRNKVHSTAGTILGNSSNTLSDACIIVDALGYSFRHELLEEFVQLQLVPYEKLIGPEKPHYSLDDADRRWAWFKRLLKSVDNKFTSIFPQHWQVHWHLYSGAFNTTIIFITIIIIYSTNGLFDCIIFMLHL